MIKAEPRIKHPMAGAAAPVLQYADDTIILIHANLESVQLLKQTLDAFAAEYTGLKINFGKSTMTPMHVPATELQAFIDHLHCVEGNSNFKLPLSAFAPLIAHVDKYLAT